MPRTCRRDAPCLVVDRRIAEIWNVHVGRVAVRQLLREEPVPFVL